MSERGIEIHNGYAVLPRLIKPISVGTRDVPITQTDTTLQQVIGAFLNTSAVGIGWDIHGVWAWISAAVDREGDVVGVEGRCYVNDGITVDGKIYGMHSRVYVLGEGAVGGDVAGLYIYLNVQEDATITGYLSAISIYNISKKSPTGNFDVIRWKDEGDQTVDAFIHTLIGSVPDINYFLRTDSSTSAWHQATDKTSGITSAGWIRVLIAGNERFIALYPPA